MPEKFDAKAILDDERRRSAVAAERAAVLAAIEADAARRLRDLVPDLRPQVEAQLVGAEQREKQTRERAAGLRSRAGLDDADYPDLTVEVERNLASLEESAVRWEERADAPDLYAGHESAMGQPDPAEFFRFQAANAKASLEANRDAVAKMKQAAKTRGRGRGAQADKQPE